MYKIIINFFKTKFAGDMYYSIINNLKGFKMEIKEKYNGIIFDYLEKISADFDLVNEPIKNHPQPNIEKGVVHFG